MNILVDINVFEDVFRQRRGWEASVAVLNCVRNGQARSWELRASTSLARLWQQQGKKTEAHKLVSEVYNWFTEGFDTKDLQEAKALLESRESGV